MDPWAFLSHRHTVWNCKNKKNRRLQCDTPTRGFHQGRMHTCGQGDPNSCQQHRPSNHWRSSCQATLIDWEWQELERANRIIGVNSYCVLGEWVKSKGDDIGRRVGGERMCFFDLLCLSDSFFFFQGRNFLFPFIPFSSFLFLSFRGDSNLFNFFIRIHWSTASMLHSRSREYGIQCMLCFMQEQKNVNHIIYHVHTCNALEGQSQTLPLPISTYNSKPGRDWAVGDAGPALFRIKDQSHQWRHVRCGDSGYDTYLCTFYGVIIGA